MKMKEIYNKILKFFYPYAGTVYSRIGGKKTIDAVVDRFYEVMSTDPLARECLETHKKDLGEVSIKLKEYLYGWLGGPQVFVQKYGHPRMRMRHIMIPISEVEHRQWIYCMEKALSESKIDKSTQEEMLTAMNHLAGIIVNK